MQTLQTHLSDARAALGSLFLVYHRLVASSFTFVIVLLGLGTVARAEIIGIEPFNYGDGTAINGQSGGSFWGATNGASASAWKQTSGTPVVSGDQFINDTTGQAAVRAYRANEASGVVSSGMLYYRVTLTTTGSLPDCFGVSAFASTAGGELVFFGKNNGAANFGLTVVGGTVTNSSLAVQTNHTYTLVAAVNYDHNLASLWVNPDLSQPEANNVPVATATFNGGPSEALRLANCSNGQVAWDDLVVATTWGNLSTVTPGTLVTTAADEDNGSLGGGTGVSLREAVNYSPPGSRITFVPALASATITLTNQINVDQPLSIDASALAGSLTLSGNHNSRIFEVASRTTVTLDSLTLTNGYGSGLGGGILNHGTLTAKNSTFAGNSATGGGIGGALCNLGRVTLHNCTLANNTADDGGGIENYAGATTTANNCTFASNTANFGGGIDISGGSVTLTNTIVAGNTAFSSSNNISGYFTGPNNVISGDPQLAPLGNYGGPTPTMPPLAGSPAIDAGDDSITNFLATDQRGLPRLAGSHVDIGAAEYQPALIVTTSADSGTGSLRDVVAAVGDGGNVTFAPALDGQTITLTGGQINIDHDLIMDASSLANAVTLSGNHNSRIFEVQFGATVTLESLTLTNGYASGDSGGGILNYGTLTANHSTFAGNIADEQGGAIFNYGLMAAAECTFFNNTAYTGGGLVNYGILTLNSSTITGNSAVFGGAIHNDAALFLTNTIVAGNTASGSDTNISGSFSGANNLTSGDPQLAPLGNHGGPTQTMPPLFGSPAIDAGNDAVAGQIDYDQRGDGFLRISGEHVDIGAVELQFAIVNDPPTLVQPAWNVAGNGTFRFTFTSVTKAEFKVLTTTNLALPLSAWTDIGYAVETPASSGQYQFTDTQATNAPQRFYQVWSPAPPL